MNETRWNDAIDNNNYFQLLAIETLADADFLGNILSNLALIKLNAGEDKIIWC